jgi:hypothetical protein
MKTATAPPAMNTAESIADNIPMSISNNLPTMKTASPTPMQKPILIGVFVISILLTYAAMSLSGTNLKSTPYAAKSVAADGKLKELAGDAGVRILNNIVAKIKTTAGTRA